MTQAPPPPPRPARPPDGGERSPSAPPPRVLYLGYGAAGCACMAELIAAGCEIAGVLCRRSDRAEHGRAGTSVWSDARRLGLRLFEATDPNAPGFVAEVRGLAPDLLLSVQYDRILKPPLLAVPRHGAFNLHFGPLPRLRGCFPTKWAILGDEPAGVTLHAIDPGIDSGDVVAQVLVPLAADETDQTLYHRLERAAVALFREQVPWMRDLRPPERRRQDASVATYHPKEIPYQGIIDWQREADWIERFIRAFTFPPHPAARTWWHGEEVQIRAPVALGDTLPGSPGEISPCGGHAIAVCCGTGSLRIDEVILGGSARPASVLTGGAPAGRRFTAEAR
jgi:methionyl-tRNA formyltransferase